MKNGTTIRLPQELVQKIDEIIEKGYYNSRSEYVTASIRYALMYYADLRKIAIGGKDSLIGTITASKLPKPINDNVSGFDLLKGKKMLNNSEQNEKLSEEQIATYYKSFTIIFLETFKTFGGDRIQVVFNYPSGLKNRARILFKKAYGFNNRMDFVRSAIVCLMIKTLESDLLYDEMDRYFS